MYELVDFITREMVTPRSLVFTGERPWELLMDLGEVKRRVSTEYFRKAPSFVSKYLPLLPISDFRNFVSLEEGGTPLIASKIIGKELGLDLFFKVEGKNPTGSFKDRGSAVEVSVARELGAEAIVVASTGNMAASCACYATAAGIPCFVFVPENVPMAKLAQVLSFNGRVVQVKGSYNDAAALAKEVAEELGYYLAGDYAFRLEGQKTAAFELIDQLFFESPDMVLVPMGCGTNIAAYKKGFHEYRELGFIETIPALVGVQALGASPIVQSFLEGNKKITPFPKVDTFASAIAIGDPLDGAKALDAIYSSHGDAVGVSDTDILKAQYDLARFEGLFVESSGAAALSALRTLSETGRVKGKKVIVVLCGDGLKDPSGILKAAIKPPLIEPRVGEFLSLLRNSFFQGSNVTFIDQAQVIFSDVPDISQVRSRLKEFLNADYPEKLVGRIQERIEQFLKRGKMVSFSDFQDIIQNELEAIQLETPKTFCVTDFSVCTAMNTLPKAMVEVELHGTKLCGEGQGVGPVDAILNALRNACNERMEFALTEYKVSIRGKGSDAVVYAETTLVRDGKPSFGGGTSPDIIQASIEAFEKAYNGL